MDLQTEINRLTKDTTEIQQSIRELNNNISTIEKNTTYIKNSKNIENKIRIPRNEYYDVINKDWELYYLYKSLNKLENKLNVKNVKLNKYKNEVNKKKERKEVKKELKNKNYDKSILRSIEKKMGKYEPEIKLLDKNLHYRNNRVIQLRFTEDERDKNKIYSKENIQDISNKVSKYLNKKNINGELITTMFYDDAGFKSGHLTDIGQEVQLYDPQINYVDGYVEEPDFYSKFLIYLIIKPKPIGGNSKNNDCLFECLDFYLHDRNPWANGGTLKQYLGLKRNDKIPISLIPKVEEKLKTFQINIIGDYVYSSQIKSNKIISLKLQDEHYTINRNIDNSKVGNIRINYKEKPIMLYDKSTYECYNGIEKRILPRNEYIKLVQDYDAEYILINRESTNIEVKTNKKKKENQKKKLTLEEEYDELIQTANELKKHSNGIINLYKTGDYKNTALNLFDRFTKFTLNPETIEQDEFIWLRNSTMGAVIFSEKYEGPGYKYDVKSMYPSIYRSTNKFPVKRGEFRTLTDKEFNEMKYYQFGIYKCKIYRSDDNNTNKLFKFNRLHYYTHTSLEHAKSLNLKIELIQDEQPNNLYYEREKLIGFNEVFTEYTNFLFSLKEKKVPKAKLLLNIIWGALTEIRKYSHIVKEGNLTKLKDEESIYQMYPSYRDEDITIVKTYNQNNIYTTNFGRLQPFILARGRFMISEIMKPIKDKIIRCHTDGFISTTDKDIKHGSKIGDLVFEGFCDNCEVINCNQVKGEFKLTQ
jgi:hypothetical protein